MKRILLLALMLPLPASALSPEAEEFMSVNRQLASMQCEKQKLRREIALAEIEKRDTSELRRRFSGLDRDPKTSPLEKRLSELQHRVVKRGDPEDLPAINRQRVEAFYRCE